MDAEGMVNIPHVHLGKYTCLLEQFKGNGEKQEEVVILHSDTVKSLTFYARGWGLVFLFHIGPHARR